MKEINIADKKVRVRATPLALLYYKQEFGTDLVGDMMKMQNLEKDPTQFDSVALLQLIWAMAKADVGPGNKFPSFIEWLSGLERFDMSETDLMQAVMEEATDGFFRRGIQQHRQQKKK